MAEACLREQTGFVRSYGNRHPARPVPLSRAACTAAFSLYDARMIGKVLFTLGVVLVVALIWRTRQPRPAPGDAQPRLINPQRRRKLDALRYLAIAVVAVLLAASVYLLYDHWRDRHEVVFVRVIDASTGRSQDYRARRGDIEDRRFVTEDGRQIVLAETERLETSVLSSPRPEDQN